MKSYLLVLIAAFFATTTLVVQSGLELSFLLVPFWLHVPEAIVYSLQALHLVVSLPLAITAPVLRFAPALAAWIQTPEGLWVVSFLFWYFLASLFSLGWTTLLRRFPPRVQ